MSIDFSKLIEIGDSKGVIVEIADSTGKALWSRLSYNYVSLGDSIAAGQGINSNDIYHPPKCYEWQYGTEGVSFTTITPNSYTDLIRKELSVRVGGKVATTSFARSGDTVEDLMEKLTHPNVQRVISKADLVTVCIGANDILGHIGGDRIPNYILTGDKSAVESGVQNSLAILDDDSNSYSYMSLLNTLTAINPTAKIVFTTVYNPYKYVHLDKCTAGADYKDGFLGPLMWAIPDVLGSLAPTFRKMFLESSVLSNVYSNVNAMSAIVEGFVSSLNDIIRRKIQACGNPNIILADTKAVFDPVPDRPISAPRHYNDLVNVEITSGYVIEDLDWGEFWSNVDWGGVISNIGSSSFFNDLATDVMGNVINNVIIPDMDPHPETDGQYALKCSFADALGWSTLPRRTITYNANGGTGSMVSQTVVALDGNAAYTNIRANGFGIPSEGYYLTGWKDGSGNSYSVGQLVGLTGDLTLNAQWTNIYTITYKHTNHTGGLYGDNETGHKECYALWIAGTEQADFGKFSEGSERKIPIAYGTRIGVICGCYVKDNTYKPAYADVYLNGANVTKRFTDGLYDAYTAYHEMDVLGDITIEFQWKISGSIVTFDAQSWEDCYITTHY